MIWNRRLKRTRPAPLRTRNQHYPRCQHQLPRTSAPLRLIKMSGSSSPNCLYSLMKILCLFALLACSLTCQAQEAIRPKVAPAFGRPVVVRAEFVSKPNDYRSQNIVSEPFNLKIIAVDGKALKHPVIIEYRLHLRDSDKKRIELLALPQTFEAYEFIYRPPQTGPWLEEGMQGSDFALVNILHIRLEQKITRSPERIKGRTNCDSDKL